jgi:hypothetical protein
MSRLVLGEVTRNLQEKALAGFMHLPLLLRSMSLEVVREAPDSDIRFWRDAGFGTDSPIIAAALEAEVDVLCTGDRKLLSDLPALCPTLRVLGPTALLDALARDEP